jgi:hypothetical protein
LLWGIFKPSDHRSFTNCIGVCYNEQCYNERMLQRTGFINKFRILQRTQMPQRTRRNTIGRRSKRMPMTCLAFPLWLERQSSSVLPSVRFSYQFSSAIWLLVLCVKVKYIHFLLLLQLIFLILYYIFPVQMVVLDGNCAAGCGPACNGLPLNTYIAVYARTNRCYNERRLWVWNGLPLNIYISVYARTNRCYNERRLLVWNRLPLNTYISVYARTNRCYNERRLWAWNRLHLSTYISMYTKTNKCYNERRLWGWNGLSLITYISV